MEAGWRLFGGKQELKMTVAIPRELERQIAEGAQRRHILIEEVVREALQSAFVSPFFLRFHRFSGSKDSVRRQTSVCGIRCPVVGGINLARF